MSVARPPRVVATFVTAEFGPVGAPVVAEAVAAAVPGDAGRSDPATPIALAHAVPNDDEVGGRDQSSTTT